MKFIASLSGGKDSTAMVLRLVEEQWPLDEVVYLDHGSWHWAWLDQHLDKIEDIIKIKITRIKMPQTFDYFAFFHKPKHRKGGYYEKKGIQLEGRGWPSKQIRWCTSQSMWCLRKYLRNNLCYTGIAWDEKKRPHKFLEHRHYKLYPLLVWRMTQKDCLRYCFSKGIDFNGHYQNFKRVSCWCCPLQDMDSLFNLYKYKPKLWNRLKEMDKLAHNCFNVRYKSVEEIEKHFEKEENKYEHSNPYSLKHFTIYNENTSIKRR